MNLLLLLSALLSALTGAGVAARTPLVAVAVTRAATDAVAPKVRTATAAGLPVAVLPTRAVQALIGVELSWSLAPVAPLYLSRRRE